MTPVQIFSLQFVLSVTVYAVIAAWYVVPRLNRLAVHDALIPLLLLHAFRHMGLVFLLPGFVGATLPAEFAVPTAYGDLATGLLAIAAAIALRYRWPLAILLAWLVNILGTADFLYGTYQGMRLQVPLGAAYYIPTVVNPAMWVAHFLMFAMLIRYWRRSAHPAGSTPIASRPAGG
jgi:hypothetical protein